MSRDVEVAGLFCSGTWNSEDQGELLSVRIAVPMDVPALGPGLRIMFRGRLVAE